MIHSLSLRLLRLFTVTLDLPSSSSPSLLLSVRIATFHRFERRTENSTSKIEWKTSSNFHDDFSNPKLLFRWKRGLLRGRVDNRPWFNYAICQPIIFDPRFARLSRFSRYAPITEINTIRLDLIAVSETRCQVFNSIPFFFFLCARFNR